MSYGYSNPAGMHAAPSSSSSSGFYPHQQGHYDAARYATQHASGSDGNMAGVGVRRLTQKQEAKRLQAEQWQRDEERRQWQATEEQRRWQADEAQRQMQAEQEYRAEQQQQQQQQEWEWQQQQQRRARDEEERRLRQHQEDEAERQRQHLQQQQWERQEEERRLQRQREDEDEQQRRRRQQRRAEEEQRHGKPEEDYFSQHTNPRRGGQTDSQATVKADQLTKSSRYDAEAAAAAASSRLQPSTAAAAAAATSGRHSRAASDDGRATVYDDDFEKPDRSPRSQHRPTSRGCLYRETIYEPLPKATCADCGEQMAFDNLVLHECLHNALQSPLLAKGPGSLSSRTNSPMPTPSISETSRSPFFDRYDGQHGSPALSSVGAHSPYMAAGSSPLVGLGTFKDGDDGEQQARMERKRHIEAQRAAKQQAAREHSPTVSPALKTSFDAPTPPAPSLLSVSPVSTPLSLPSPPLLNAVAASHTRSHRRALDSHSSNASSTASSSLSSSSSAFFKRTPGTLTPSSSNELVSSSPLAPTQLASQLRIKHSPPRRALDLQDLEGLVREIENSPASPARSMTAPPSKAAEARREKRSETLEPPVVRSRRPSEAAATAARSTAPVMRRARTNERAQDAKLCSVCLRAFARNQPMVKRDGKLFCIDDYAELYLEKCRKCRLTVRTVGVRSRDGALSGLFHRECFSCLQCDATFDDGTFYVLDNAPYCAPHYHVLNGTLCGACGTGIEGQCRQLTPATTSAAGGERFHMHCLTCQFDDGKEFCKDLLNDYFVYDGKRLCQWHFEKVTAYVRQRAERRQQHQQQPDSARRNDDAVSAAALRAARRTTYLHTVQAKKGRA